MRVSAASPRGRPPGNPRATQGLGRGFVAKACPTRGALERFCVFGKIPRGPYPRDLHVICCLNVQRFSPQDIVLLYFVTTNKLDKAFFILITFLQEENLLSINVTDFPDTCCSYFRYFTFKLRVRMRLWNYGYNTHVFI